MCSTTQFCFLNLRTYFIYLCCYLLIMVAAGSRVVNGLKCYCNPKECDILRSLDCPGKGLMLWDPCKCCRICAKTAGETCGGPGGFSGQCEPPLQCVTKLPISSGLGVCRDLRYASTAAAAAAFASLYSSPLSSSSSSYSSFATYHHPLSSNCTNDETITIEAGCEITNKRCQCWPALRLCRSDIDGNSVDSPTTDDTRWHFRTLEDCQLNLQNLIKLEMEFDEDYTISPSTFTYKKLRRKRRTLRKKTTVLISQ